MPGDRACGNESNNVIDLEISKIDPSCRFLLNLVLFNYLTKNLCLGRAGKGKKVEEKRGLLCLAAAEIELSLATLSAQQHPSLTFSLKIHLFILEVFQPLQVKCLIKVLKECIKLSQESSLTILFII